MSAGADDLLKIALTAGFSILATLVASRAKRSTDRAERDEATEKAALVAQTTGQYEVQRSRIASETDALRMAYARIQELEAARDKTMQHAFDLHHEFMQEREEHERVVAKLRADRERDREQCEAEVAQLTGAFHAATSRAEAVELALQKLEELTRSRKP